MFQLKNKRSRRSLLRNNNKDNNNNTIEKNDPTNNNTSKNEDKDNVDPSLLSLRNSNGVGINRLNCLGGGGGSNSSRRNNRFNGDDQMDIATAADNSPVSRSSSNGGDLAVGMKGITRSNNNSNDKSEGHNDDNNDDQYYYCYDVVDDDRIGTSSMISGISAPSLDEESLYTATFSYNAGYMKDDDDVSSMNSASIVGRAIHGMNQNHNKANRYESSSEDDADDDDDDDDNKDHNNYKKNKNVDQKKEGEDNEEHYSQTSENKKNKSDDVAVLGVIAPPCSYSYQYDLEEESYNNNNINSRRSMNQRPPRGYSTSKTSGGGNNKNSLGKLAVSGALAGNPTALAAKKLGRKNNNNIAVANELVDDDDDLVEKEQNDEMMRCDNNNIHHPKKLDIITNNNNNNGSSVVSGYSEDGDICSIVDDGVLSFVDLPTPSQQHQHQQKQQKKLKLSQSNNYINYNNNRSSSTTIPTATITTTAHSMDTNKNKGDSMVVKNKIKIVTEEHQPPMQNQVIAKTARVHENKESIRYPDNKNTIKVLSIGYNTSNHNSNNKKLNYKSSSAVDDHPISTSSSNDEENSDDVMSLTRQNPQQPITNNNNNNNNNNIDSNGRTPKRKFCVCCCVPKWIQNAPHRLKSLLFLGMLLLSGSIALVAMGFISEFQKDNDNNNNNNHNKKSTSSMGSSSSFDSQPDQQPQPNQQQQPQPQETPNNVVPEPMNTSTTPVVNNLSNNWTVETYLNNKTYPSPAPTAALTMAPTEIYNEDKTIVYFTAGSYKNLTNNAKQLSRIPSYYNTSFMVHLGDWNEANNTQCDEQSYIDVSHFYQNSSVPVYFVIGDNDFTDCVDPAEAKQYWADYLADYESKYWNEPDWVVWREGNEVKEYSNYYENFDLNNNRNVAFVALSVPGGDVNTDEEDGDREFLIREDANFVWLDASYQFYRGSVDVLVVMFHDALPGSNIANRLFFTTLFNKIQSDYADMNFLIVNRNADDDNVNTAHSHQFFRQYNGITNLNILSVGGPVWPPVQVTIETNGDGIMPDISFDGHDWYYDLWGIRNS